MRKSLLLLVGCVFYASALIAQSAADLVVPVTVTTTANPPSITLNFPATANAVSTLIGRKTINQTSWNFIVLPAAATTFTDNNVVDGVGFEYMVVKQASVAPTARIGLVYAGIGVPAVVYRGKIILVIDDALTTPLAAELDRLVWDLRGDGWQVVRHDITTASSTVASVKELIRQTYEQDPDNTVSAFLIGDIPVPYSGEIAPDGHLDHIGAWPTDYYYGDMDEAAWTDTIVNNSSAARPANWNVPGDGKFDQSQTPTLPEIVVSRLDFSNLGGWDISQTELYRRYLNKNHAFRTGVYRPDAKTLIDDNFGYSGGEAFAQNGWRNGYALTGSNSITAGDFFDNSANQSFLLGYGCGPGNYQGASGVGNSARFQTDSVNIVFSQLFGSYFGDWDFETNPFMPSALASKGGILTCAWAGRPNYNYHHMGLGQPIMTSMFWVWLNSFLSTQVYPSNLADDLVHVGMLGDPTLRAHAVRPPENVMTTVSCDNIRLDWKSSSDTILGYVVYRAPSPDSIYELLVASLIGSTSFTDSMPLPGMNYYMVKSFRLETVPTGSYYNQSTGAAGSANFNPATLNVVAAGTSVSCAGTADGAVDLTVSGGASFTYLWSTGAVTEDLTGLAPGSYTVTVTNDQGCTATASVAITEPAALALAAQVENITCFGAADGAIMLSVSGGVQPYQFLWSNGIQEQNSGNLMPGVYTVTMTDANGCTETSTSSITEPDALALSIFTVDAGCSGASDGIVSTAVSGGTPGYAYSWSNNTVTPNLINVPAGTYTVVVTDINGCSETGSAVVGEPPAIGLSATATNAGCAGATNGAIDLTTTGGTPGYTFLWSNGASEEDLAGIAAGTYTVTVTDAAGCTQTSSATVGQVTTLSLETVAEHVSCPGFDNGLVVAQADGGDPDYSYLWSTGDTTALIGNLPGGTYTVTVTDAAGCTITAELVVSEPPALEVSLTVQPVSCFGEADGSTAISVSGGTPGYSFLWSNGSTGQTVDALAAGTYTVTITDANGCTTTAEAILTEPVLLTAAVVSVSHVSCPGAADGTATAEVSGGTAPYSYLWSDANNSATSTVQNLPQGSYSVLVTDANGCTETAAVSITEPVPPAVTIAGSDTACINVPALYNLPAGLANFEWTTSAGGTILQGQGTSEVFINWIETGEQTLTVFYTWGLNCPDSVQLPVFADVCVGTREPMLSGVTVWPNPFRERLTVHFDHVPSPGTMMRLFDAAGRLVTQRTVLAETTQLDTGMFAAGSYLLQIVEQGLTGAWSIVKFE